MLGMDNSEVESGGVGVLESSVVSDPTSEVVDGKSFPDSLNTVASVPESADSLGIVDKLHEFDTKRVGDDRRVRHERAKYIDELFKTQSKVLLKEAASHFMSVGQDGKIKDSSSVMSLRDRLVIERGVQLKSEGMSEDQIIQGQVDLYREILTQAASYLPEEQREYYLKYRLNPNVNAKAASLREIARKKRVGSKASVQIVDSVPPTDDSKSSEEDTSELNKATSATNNVSKSAEEKYTKNFIGKDDFKKFQEEANSGYTPLEIEQGKPYFDSVRNKREAAYTQSLTSAADDADTFRKGLQGGGVYVNPSDPEDLAGQRKMVDRQIAEMEATKKAQEEAAAAAREQAEADYTKDLTSAADAAEAYRKDNPNYIKLGDPEDLAGQQEMIARQKKERSAVIDSLASRLIIEGRGIGNDLTSRVGRFARKNLVNSLSPGAKKERIAGGVESGEASGAASDLEKRGIVGSIRSFFGRRGSQ